MLSYNSFKKKVLAEIINYLPSDFKDCKVSTKEVSKVNEIKDAIVLSNESKENMIIPIFYIQDMFKEYKKNGDFEGVMVFFADLYKTAVKPNFEDLNLDHMEDTIRDKVVLQLISSKNNERLLSQCPYMNFLDLKVLFRVIMKVEKNGISSFLLTHELCETYNLDMDEIYGLAYKNTLNILGHKERSMKEILCEMISNAGVSKKEAERVFSTTPMRNIGEKIIVATDKYKFIGANLMLFTNYLSSIADKFNSSLVIVPSSVRDLMFVSSIDFENIDSLRDMILDLIQKKINPEDNLSDSLYYFDRERKELFIMYGDGNEERYVDN